MWENSLKSVKDALGEHDAVRFLQLRSTNEEVAILLASTKGTQTDYFVALLLYTRDQPTVPPNFRELIRVNCKVPNSRSEESLRLYLAEDEGSLILYVIGSDSVSIARISSEDSMGEAEDIQSSFDCLEGRPFFGGGVQHGECLLLQEGYGVLSVRSARETDKRQKLSGSVAPSAPSASDLQSPGDSPSEPSVPAQVTWEDALNMVTAGFRFFLGGRAIDSTGMVATLNTVTLDVARKGSHKLFARRSINCSIWTLQCWTKPSIRMVTER